jgi:transcriptional regulator with XRE-family HTH domain
MIETRATMHCERCGLVQFLHHDELCARCHESFWSVYAKPVPVPPVIAAVIAAPLTNLTKRERHRVIARWLAPRLLGFRKGLHLSQTRLAVRMGTVRTYLTKCESGKCVPDIGSLERFAKAFGVTTAQLLDLDFDPDPLIRELAPLAGRLTARQREHVVAAAREIHERRLAS